MIGRKGIAGIVVAGTLAIVMPAGAVPLLLDPAKPPEDPLPAPPPPLGVAPEQPPVMAPDARAILEQCQKPDFTECLRDWRPPPPPPPPPPPDEAASSGGGGGAQSPGQPKPAANGKPPEPQGPPPFSPPAPDIAGDQATYDALVKAIHEQGLEGKVLLPEPPKDGSATMHVAPNGKNATSPKDAKAP